MKEIKAYIKKHKLDEVTRALHKIDGLTGMSVMERSGYGIGWTKAKTPERTDFIHGIKLEIICCDELVEKVISAIKKAAHTGLKGDGKIYVANIEQAFRISSGENGEKAV
ncbi:MAG: P-II family nitrogen regulator [Proteobacteria bacterium]|nr:P-II family nitrogen regulator [Pseudomonadota bacterium]MBU4469374.1 P-II family nitrogen regulator [Pseudomonadota bacterium]MCG2750487.1 P-II family nitrogen regulator [Desulfobacteraceae bacterium]